MNLTLYYLIMGFIMVSGLSFLTYLVHGDKTCESCSTCKNGSVVAPWDEPCITCLDSENLESWCKKHV